MNRFLVYVVTIFVLSSPFQAFARQISNEDIYRELKVFQAKTEERFAAIDKRFDQIDKRFEQVNNRFGDMFNFLWMLTGIFTVLTTGVIGFAYWDRRTIIGKAQDETV